ncbi:hypothetical protein [Brachybacterium epidermidis]|uniref:hypothetical protein n=1 Tax=Brachybacterium epidermidis TaxID=2781983 RepID=UPI00398E3C02
MTTPAASSADQTGRATSERTPTGASTVLGLLIPALPASRITALRTIVYAFVIVDVLLIANDVPSHAGNAHYFRPLLLARLLHLPPVTTGLAYALLVVIVVACLMAMLGRFPRIAGMVVGVAFGIWMLYSQGYGYVSHDHLALMVAVWVLPTVPSRGWHDDTPSEAAGWALRCIQLAVVATYFLSVLVKWIYSGSPIAWANSAILAWAVVRRGSIFVQWTLETPWIFVPAQWAALAMETLSPVVLFLRGKALYLAVAVFVGFHLTTFIALGIHFLPTVICWAAFLPIERLRELPARLRRH